MRVKKEKPGKDGWTRWILPAWHEDACRSETRIICCDCGLAHDVEFGLADDRENTGRLRTMFRTRRNNRSTAQVRRHIPQWPYVC